MAIKTETISLNDKNFLHTYSDSGYYIRQAGTGIVYADAIDPADSGRTYTETIDKIEAKPTDAEHAEYAEAVKK